MKHQISKFKVKDGSDANQMLLKKLVRNFIAHGKLVTTLKKAKPLSAIMQRLVHKAASGSEASLNVLLPFLQNKKSATLFIDEVKLRLGANPTSGSVRVVKLGNRIGDAAPVARVEWTREMPEAKKVEKKA
ncbi:MAG: L17 family ribosomal protein [bacterium]